MPAAGGIYRIDPPPVQRVQYAPIPAQGSQPPKFSIVKSMVCVLASWPTGMEPGLPQPDFHRARIAPLTLVYGQQPPRWSFVDQYVAIQKWPTGMEPGLPQPDLHRGYIVPLTLAYGGQPPVSSGQRDIDVLYQTVLPAWQPPDPLPQPLQNKTAAWNVVLITQPPFTPLPLSIIGAWQPVTLPRQRLNNIAPLTLATGQQPPPYSGLSDPDVLYSVVGAWQPPPPQPQRDRGYIVPLTLIYGNQPPPLSGPELTDLVATWQPAQYQPQRPANIAPLLSVIVVQPYPLVDTELMAALVASWQPQTTQQRERKIIPPAAGNQPPTYSTVNQMLLVSAWQPLAPMPQRSLPSTSTLLFVSQAYCAVAPQAFAGGSQYAQSHYPGSFAFQFYVSGSVFALPHVPGSVEEQWDTASPASGQSC